MLINDILISDFSDSRFQVAFKQYFGELGINVKDWDGLFREMNSENQNKAYVRFSEDNQVIGFIQFTPMEMSSWFFNMPCGFIREFWIAEEYRNQGHGTALIALAEQYFRGNGIHKLILTTDTAPEFYRARGYEKDDTITARNKDDVYTKWIR